MRVGRMREAEVRSSGFPRLDKLKFQVSEDHFIPCCESTAT